MPYAVMAALVLASGVLAFWQSIGEMVSQWIRQDDYSHGWFVLPVALLILYVRRDSRPALGPVPGWGGFALLIVALATRAAGHAFYLTPLWGWGLVLWVGAAVWILCGWRTFLWALPGIGFLIFMVPLPFRAEQLLAGPMQGVATAISTFMLQVATLPAVSEGNIILLGSHQLEVAQACSGLRMLLSVTAAAVAFGLLAKRPWGEWLLLLAAVVPIAVLANCVRIFLTGLAFWFLPHDVAATFAHDLAGYLVIPLALLMMWGLLAYWNALFVRVEQVSDHELLRTDRPMMPQPGR
jgi:exosortase